MKELIEILTMLVEFFSPKIYFEDYNSDLSCILEEDINFYTREVENVVDLSCVLEQLLEKNERDIERDIINDLELLDNTEIDTHELFNDSQSLNREFPFSDNYNSYNYQDLIDEVMNIYENDNDDDYYDFESKSKSKSKSDSDSDK